MRGEPARRRRLAHAALLLLLAAPAHAQDTREALIAQAQAEKAQRLEPYEPNRVEAVLQRLQGALILTPEGFYPVFGSVYSGGGFTLGAGYRRYLGDRVNWSVSGLYSLKNYKLIEFGLQSPRPLSGRLDWKLDAGWRDATQVAYHGLGIDSQDEEAQYRMEQGFAGGKAWFRPRRWAVLHAAVGYEGFTIADGQGHAPDVDDVFTPATAPGLGDHPDFLRLTWSAAIDTRNSPDYTRRGALLEIAHHAFRDLDNVYDFERLDAEVIEHLPFFREAFVLSLRGRLQTTLDSDDAVPFFLMPSLGSGSTLRGFSSWRFRDKHSVLFSAEWRWLPNRMAMDAAVFYDAGTVADRFDALSLGRMKSDVGFGVRFHSPVVTPLRIEVAWGGSGPRLIFAASSAF
jgi:hypothetical protein